MLSEQPDDAIIVTVTACAELEMGWHLFTSGNAVEVLEPQSLRELPAQKRRKAWRQA